MCKKIITKTTTTSQAEYYTVGDSTKADYYISIAKKVWQKTDGAIEWLKKYQNEK